MLCNKIFKKNHYLSQGAKNLDILESPYSIFNVINSMVNLRYLELETTGISQIPTNALKNEHLCSILTWDLSNINNNAYRSLKNFGGKNCTGQSGFIRIGGEFNFIPSNAFVIEDTDNTELVLTISNSKLNGTGFEKGAFTYTNKRLKIQLIGNRELKFLDEIVFGPLFVNSPNSSIVFSRNPLDCENCEMKWIIEKELVDKLKNPTCSNMKSFKNLTLDDFEHCSKTKSKKK
jgi:hypothetical protein